MNKWEPMPHNDLSLSPCVPYDSGAKDKFIVGKVKRVYGTVGIGIVSGYDIGGNALKTDGGTIKVDGIYNTYNEADKSLGGKGKFLWYSDHRATFWYIMFLCGILLLVTILM